MSRFVIKRIVQLVVVLFIVSVLVFVGMRVWPGDSTNLVVAQSDKMQMTDTQIDNLRHQAGLDRNLAVQYVTWMGGLFKGDMGNSVAYKIPVATQIVHGLPVTLAIGLLAWIAGTLIGVVAGILCAAKRGTWVDTLIRNLANLGVSVPVFFLSLVLIYFISLKLGWLAPQGFIWPTKDFWLSIRLIIMPVMSLALLPMAIVCWRTRLALLEVGEDKTPTSGPKGLKRRPVNLRQAFKNSLAPVVAVSGVTFSAVIGWAVLVETIFNIPGLGSLTLTAVYNLDYNYLQGIVLVVATLVLVVYFLLDLLHFWLDRRFGTAGSDLKTDAATGDTIQDADPALRDSGLPPLRRAFIARPMVKVGLVILALFLLTAIFASLIAPHAPNELYTGDILQSPSWSHPLGTDQLGRDIFSRFVYASRPALIVAVSVGAIAAIVGGLLGLLAGFLGGWVNYVIMRVTDAFMAIPLLVLAMVIVALAGGGTRNVSLALSVGMVPVFVRVMRDVVLRVKDDGQSLRHCLRPFLVLVAGMLGAVVLVESGLSFLGLGLKPPLAAWGSMVADGRTLLLSNPWLVFAPGVALVLVIFAINTVGDGLRDALEPRLRGII